LEWFPLPFAWAGFVNCGILLILSGLASTSFARLIWLNLAILFFLFAGTECVLWSLPSAPVVKNRSVIAPYSPAYFTNHEILGYSPHKDGQWTWSEHIEDELIYQAKYTINKKGLRVAAPYQENPVGAVLFFGCSMAYGAGVNDEDAMPYRIGVHTKGLYHVYNFAFHGYGQHQMLAALEQGVVDSIVEEKVTHIFCLLIAEHGARAVGSSWDPHGPKYKLQDDGTVEFSGHFDDTKIEVPKRDSSWITDQMQKSRLLKGILERLAERSVTPRLLERLVAIVKKARVVSRERYPGSQFAVIFWDVTPLGQRYDESIKANLTNSDVDYFLVSEIIPDIIPNEPQYILHEFDTHPNQLAHDKIADFLASHVIVREMDGERR
jgi:hypothetical protein